MWLLEEIDKFFNNVMNNTTAWNLLQIVKIDNASYHETIQNYELPWCYFKTRLQFELLFLEHLYERES
jgi:hypothetical protein